MKTCTKCGETKPAAAFPRRKTAPDGLSWHCKACKKAYADAYQAANRDTIAAQKRTYNAATAARTAEQRRAYRVENREAKAEYDRRYRRTNREAIAERKRANPHVGWESLYRRRAQKFDVEPVIESFTRDDLVSRYGDACFHCKTGLFEELDHYPVPVALGGPHTLDNVKPSCAACNRAQGRPIREARNKAA